MPKKDKDFYHMQVRGILTVHQTPVRLGPRQPKQHDIAPYGSYSKPLSQAGVKSRVEKNAIPLHIPKHSQKAVQAYLEISYHTQERDADPLAGINLYI